MNKRSRTSRKVKGSGEKSYPWATRVNPTTDDVVHTVLTELEAQGLSKRAIMTLLCRNFAGQQPEDFMTIQMPAGMIKRYIEKATREVLSEMGLVTIEELEAALSNVSFASDPDDTARYSGRVGDASDDVKALIAYHLEDQDDEDYSKW